MSNKTIVPSVKKKKKGQYQISKKILKKIGINTNYVQIPEK